MEKYFDETINDFVLTAGPANWVVTKVKPLDNYILALCFHDGKQGLFDMKPYLEHKAFAPLKNEGFFKKAYADGITVVWNDNIDIAPEHLYENCQPSDAIEWE